MTEVTECGLSKQSVYRAMGRIKHYGFLAIAAYPSKCPSGFAAYFQTVDDLSGVRWNRTIRVHAYAETMTGPINVQVGVHDNRYAADDFYGQTQHNLALFGRLAGETVIEELDRLLYAPPAQEHLLSFVGFLRDRGVLLGELTFVQRTHLLPPACMVLQTVRQETKSLLLKEENKAMLHNLEQHCKYLLPAYLGG